MTICLRKCCPFAQTLKSFLILELPKLQIRHWQTLTFIYESYSSNWHLYISDVFISTSIS